jgi:AsmA protein
LGSTAEGSHESSGGDSGSLSEDAFSIRQLKITEGRITFINGNKKQSVYDDVNLVVRDFSPSSSFPFTLTASLPGGGRLKLEGKAGPLNKTDMVLTAAAAELDVADMDPAASGFVAPDSGISGILNFKGTLTSDGSRAESKGQAEADKLQLVRGGAPAGRPISVAYAVDYDLASQKGALSSGEIKSGQAVAHISGNYSMRGENLVLNLRLHGTDMPLQDLEPLLPAFGVTLPSGASLQGGSLNVDLTSKGPIEELASTGTVDISNTRLTGFDLAGKMAALASIAGIRSSNVTDIETLASGIRMSPEGIDVRDLLLIMPALGRLSGSGRVNNDQSLDFTMRAALKASGALGAGLGNLIKNDTLNIPFFVRGTSSDPKFVLDTKNAAAGFLESQLGGSGTKETQTEPGKALGNMLDNLLKKEK